MDADARCKNLVLLRRLLLVLALGVDAGVADFAVFAGKGDRYFFAAPYLILFSWAYYVAFRLGACYELIGKRGFKDAGAQQACLVLLCSMWNFWRDDMSEFHGRALSEHV